jgi:hypothetical protein
LVPQILTHCKIGVWSIVNTPNTAFLGIRMD